MKKTILITSYHALISRNIISSGIIPILLESGIRIVIAVQEKQLEYFKKNFGQKDVVIIAIDPQKLRGEGLVQLASMGLTTPFNLFLRNLWADGNRAKVIFAQTVYYSLSRFFFLKSFIRWIVATFFKTNNFKKVFETYKPDLVFATDIFNPHDVKCLLEARGAGIKTVGMVRSWDNTSTRGVLHFVPEEIVVHNKIIKDELISYNKIDGSKIHITGIPHHDKILTPPRISKDDFFKKYGLDPKKKTVFYSPGGRMQYKFDGEFLKMLQKLTETESFSQSVQFVVSEQPGDVLCKNGFDFSNAPNMILITLGVNLTGRKKESEITKEDDEDFVTFLYYSDIVLTLVSSVTLDGTFYDTPVIVLGFDPKKDLSDSVRKFTKYKHFKKLLGHNLLSVSDSEKEFVTQMNQYLNNPHHNEENRKKLTELYAYKIDGNSSRRVAECILNALK